MNMKHYGKKIGIVFIIAIAMPLFMFAQANLSDLPTADLDRIEADLAAQVEVLQAKLAAKENRVTVLVIGNEESSKNVPKDLLDIPDINIVVSTVDAAGGLTRVRELCDGRICPPKTIEPLKNMPRTEVNTDWLLPKDQPLPNKVTLRFFKDGKFVEARVRNQAERDALIKKIKDPSFVPQPPRPNRPPVPPLNPLPDPNDPIVRLPKPVLFSAAWCGPCQSLKRQLAKYPDWGKYIQVILQATLYWLFQFI